MHPSASVRELLKADDDMGLDAGTILVIRGFPRERKFQAFRRRYDEISS
jgi:hypothetical protein